jgi:hypothetical protein
MPSKSFAWVLTSLAVVTFVGIGGLQMYRVNVGWVTSYGADVLLPVVLYFWVRLGKTVLWNRPLGARPSFLLVLAGCFAWEWSQAYDFEGTPLAIAGGTSIQLTLQRTCSVLSWPSQLILVFGRESEFR